MKEEEKPSKKEIDIEVLKLQSEVEKYKADKTSESVSKLVDAFNKLVDAFKEYYLKTTRTTLLAAWILVGIIFLVTAFLTYLGKIGGETFSFVAGTIVGYIISLLGAKR
jgi:hypothetical protein